MAVFCNEVYHWMSRKVSSCKISVTKLRSFKTSKNAENLITPWLCTDLMLVGTMLIVLLLENVLIRRKRLIVKECVTFSSDDSTKLKQKEGYEILAMY